MPDSTKTDLTQDEIDSQPVPTYLKVFMYGGMFFLLVKHSVAPILGAVLGIISDSTHGTTPFWTIIGIVVGTLFSYWVFRVMGDHEEPPESPKEQNPELPRKNSF